MATDEHATQPNDWSLSGDPVAQKMLALVERSDDGLELAKAKQRHPGAEEALEALARHGFVREVLTTRKVMTGSRADMVTVAVYKPIGRATPESIEEAEASLAALRAGRRGISTEIQVLRAQYIALRARIRVKNRKRAHVVREIEDLETLLVLLKAQRP